MKIRATLMSLVICIIFLLLSCSSSTVIKLNEEPIDFDSIGYEINWDTFVRSHDYHLSFYYNESLGWTAGITNYTFQNKKPSVSLKINDQKIDVDWGSMGQFDLPVPPPWFHGRVSIQHLDLQMGQNISIQITSEKGTSNLKLTLPYEKPLITDTSETYKQIENFDFFWNPFKIADFQAVSVNFMTNYSIEDMRSNFFDYDFDYFKSVPNGSTHHVIHFIPFNPEYYPIEVHGVHFSIINTSAVSTGSHIITAMAQDQDYKVSSMWID